MSDLDVILEFCRQNSIWGYINGSDSLHLCDINNGPPFYWLSQRSWDRNRWQTHNDGVISLIKESIIGEMYSSNHTVLLTFRVAEPDWDVRLLEVLETPECKARLQIEPKIYGSWCWRY